MPANSIIQAKNLHKQYEPPDGTIAVKKVSFDIHQGEVFSLLGPNGAGKTTTISILSCLLDPTTGDATIGGHSIKDDPQAVKRIIGVVPQEIALYPTLTAKHNLRFWGKMYGLSGAQLDQRIDTVLGIANLVDRADDKVESYSGGMKRRLNIAVGLLHEPKVLYMDEPTVGIDPQSRRRILDTIQELNDDGMTVLYTTHYMEEAEELSDRIGIIDHGDLIAVGSQTELTKQMGSLDIVRLQFDGEFSADELTTTFGQLAGVQNVTADEEGLLLQVEEANGILPAFIQTTTAHNLRLRGIDIQEPNLEALFLHLTGRALRD